MIGSALAWGKTGYTIIEEGELNRQTWALDVHHYLIARPNGQPVAGTYTLEEAKARIEALEAGE
ncbi:hypothetical protein A11A3_04880 [Alcanivorax hongdengensis A-11-3]|uniref:Uncharacterized protein n=1 Tax=Alcanivorax hongdengensis A-11-3 TaxID=1177179 RepID=L0WE13_9GAMM|nr:hypothetical protein [Alcanivorax hongdengensis]EKF75286.1 hypothetical protein A11A3_04880 [Alcanivorax hongdengensis A-11-3]